jgi:hypothetical protein
LQEAINSYRSEPPMRDINLNQEFSLNWLYHPLSMKIGRGFYMIRERICIHF